MTTTVTHQDSLLMKEGNFVHAYSHRDLSGPRKTKGPKDNKHVFDDTGENCHLDSSFPDIEKGKQKRLTKTQRVNASHKTDVEPLKLHLPRVNTNPSLVGSEKKDNFTEKDQDEGLCRPIAYTDYPILKRIQENVIGQDLVIDTPYGDRNVVYCDFTASGRSLAFIENYIKKHVVPTYANTHSTTGHNARQTGKFREEARTMIKNCVNTGKDDVVIFTGSGATAAMHKLAWALKINQTNVAKDTVVITGPYEHHSNILPWKEYGTKVIRIRDEPETGMVDLQHLQDELKTWKEKRRHILVCMSAASNVTGIITDTDAVASLAHKYGAYVAFDYAAGGPYLKIDMNRSKTEYKDAVILSPHKFVGGPGTPGIIVAKKWIFKNPVPDRVGGGTVKYVTREFHNYSSNIEEREEGGTPAIIESIRAGLVFKLKQDVGEDLIQAREEELCSRAFRAWEKNPSMIVLGNHAAERIPIFSFLTMHTDTGKLVHHNFISTLLSDLFGIQARGGCACAGPYGADLLGFPEYLVKKFLQTFVDVSPNDKNAPTVSMEIMKPGFTRINLAYFYDDDTINYIISAVDMVTKYGWKLLPQYTFDIKSGSWTHKDFSNQEESQLETLEDADIFKDRGSRMSRRLNADAVLSYDEALAAANLLFDEAEEGAKLTRISSASLTLREILPRDKRKYRWFLTPSEAMNIMADKNESYLDQKLYSPPFKVINPAPRSVNLEVNSDYHSGRSVHSGRTDQSGSLTGRSSIGSKERYTGKNNNKTPKPRNDGSLTERDSKIDQKHLNWQNGSQTERSDRVVKSGRSNNKREQDENSNGSPGRTRDMSKQRPERLTLKDRFHQENSKRKNANKRLED